MEAILYEFLCVHDFNCCFAWVAYTEFGIRLGANERLFAAALKYRGRMARAHERHFETLKSTHYISQEMHEIYSSSIYENTTIEVFGWNTY